MENGVMMQYFEWNLPNDGMLWKRLKDDASHLHEIGIRPYGFHPRTKAMSKRTRGMEPMIYMIWGSSTKKGPYAPSMELNRNFKK